MSKICFPHHTRGDFDSLQEAYGFLRKTEGCWTSGTLFNIISTNVRYRNHYRDYGFYGLMALLLDEECLIAQDKDTMNFMGQVAKQWRISDYDIQCYNVNDQITIMGHTFDGLKDIKSHVGISAQHKDNVLECNSDSDCRCPDGIHVGLVYEAHPIDDGIEAHQNRTCQNFIFKNRRITSHDFESLCGNNPHGSNFCMVHEFIPEDFLPILYYWGVGNYMLLATPRVK